MARILVLDNHDDFGGHAKRNEFAASGARVLGYGGSQSLEAPGRYSAVAKSVLADLGVDTRRFYQAFDRDFYARRGLTRGVFFDRQTFGADHLATGIGKRPWANVLAGAPLASDARRDILRLFDGSEDYMPGLTSAEKKDRLARMSYRDFLVKVARITPDAVPYFQAMTHDLYGVGIDAVPALDLWGLGDYPGFQGLGLDPGTAPGISLTAIPHPDDEEPYIFHFPDGNASIARLLVRQLVPAAIRGHTMDDIVSARVNYAKLDDAGSPVRIRLNSTAVRVRHLGDPERAHEVEVTYVRGGKAWRVRSPACVLACWNGMIPYLCPEMPARQRTALLYGVKVPLVYTNVALRSWTAFERLGVYATYAPGSYHTEMTLDFPVSLGEYHFARGPADPIIVHMLRTPCHPGLAARDQHRAGHYELLRTPFATFERNIRDQMGRTLGPGGFDPARDIAAITVNRWPHGYAYEYQSLWDTAVWPGAEQPCVVGRQPFGRITIANSDAGAYAYADSAIDQAHRAVTELVARVPIARS